MFCPARSARAALLLVTLLPHSAASQDPASSPAAPRDDAYRPLGPDLFPLYQHYLRTADQTEVRNVLYLYASTDNPGGSWSRLLAPLFFRSVSSEPKESLFYLFPLLFFHKSSEEEAYNFSLPLYYDYRTPDSAFQMLLPAWVRTEADKITRHHVLFPLFRHTQDDSIAETPVTSSRTGIWKILELWESRGEPGVTDYRALNLFNWRDETKSGLPLLFSYSWAQNGDSVDGKTYLFPFYWHGRTGSSEYRWFVPFYGASRSPGESDHFILPLLSRFGGDSQNERRLDLLFPLFHYAEGPKSFSVASFPLFGYSSSETEASWNVLFWPYRTTHTFATGKRTHSFFFPLSNFDVEPDESQGSRWLFPYIETFNEKRLWRFVVPLYYEYQTLAGGSTDWFFRTGLPLYWSWGYPEDSFSMGFPLYWASRNGPRGWQLFLPLFLSSYSASSYGVHVFPLVSYRSLPSRKQLSLLGPTYFHESFYGLEGEPTGSGNHVLWPFFGVENRSDGYLYRFLPLFWTSRDGDSSDLLVTPFYYQASGPEGTHRYFMPFYGRYETPKLTRDYYAAASYVRTREKTESGALARERDDILWSLLSFEKEHTVGASHQHILPLAYWNTRTQAEDYTVAGPLYYSHRITEGDEDHYLNLVLGNVFLSKIIEGTRPEEPPPIPEVAAKPVDTEAEAAKSPAPVAKTDDAPPASPVRARKERIWSDQGVLWPLTRWYKDASGSEGAWAMPVYWSVKDNLSSHFALFPLVFSQKEETPYNLNYFRYFFLFDKEEWRGGYRYTLGQLLFDWKAEETNEAYRWRLLYPLLEHEWSRDGYSFQLTPLFNLSRKEGTTNHWLFPFFWMGGTERKLATGETRFDSRHFFLFPLYGIHQKPAHSDHYVLFPFVHFQTSNEAFRFELWPSFFYRDEPTLFATRVWPLHSEEHGVTAGDFWVSRFLFLSKHFVKGDDSEYRLDPFLFRASSGPDKFGIGGPLELFAYDREGASSSYRAIPLVFGYSKEDKNAIGVIPLYFGKDFGKEEIDYLLPWRFLFLSHHLKGASGERHTGVLWKLFERTSNPNRPEFGELGFLYRFFFSRHTETSSQIQVNPLFSYFRDETEDESRWSFLLSLYSLHTVKGRREHTLFYFLSF